MSTGKYKMVDGEMVELTPEELSPEPTEEQIAAVRAQQELQECLLSRQEEYGSIQSQLDLLYWDQMRGTTAWKDSITAVKSKYPKPE